MKIESPEAFTGAASIAFLALAKVLIGRLSEFPTGGDFASMMAYMRRSERRMPSVIVTLAYVVGECSEITQQFEIAGIVRAGTALRKREEEGATNVWEPDPEGLTAQLDYLMVLEA
jgi:hypothetical protein